MAREYGDRLGFEWVASDAANKQAYFRLHPLPIVPDEIIGTPRAAGTPNRSLRMRVLKSSQFLRFTNNNSGKKSLKETRKRSGMVKDFALYLNLLAKIDKQSHFYSCCFKIID